MRTFSTPESALKGEITKLAIVECVISIAVYIAIGYYRHTFFHYTWAIAIAPLMLFRTDESSQWGLDLYGHVHDLFFDGAGLYGVLDRLDTQHMGGYGYVSDFGLIIVAFLLAAFLVFGSLGVRLVATLYWLFRRPVHAISEMPRNWIRQALCVDFHHPPEIIPLEATRGFKSNRVPTLLRVLERIRSEGDFKSKISLGFLFLPVFVMQYLPPLIYRVSFKATALVYAPFVWVAHTSLHSPLSIRTRLERFTKGEMEKVRRAFSLFVLGVIGLKLGIIIGWFDINQLLAKIPSPKLISSVVEPMRFPWWQGTLVTDALITFALLFFADAALARLDQNVWPERLVVGTISGATFLRNVFSILTMAHLCRIAILEVAASRLSNVFGR